MVQKIHQPKPSHWMEEALTAAVCRSCPVAQCCQMMAERSHSVHIRVDGLCEDSDIWFGQRDGRQNARTKDAMVDTHRNEMEGGNPVAPR